MHIEHVALWTPDLERSRAFYQRYFGAAAGDRYTNPDTGFSSYFLRFEGGSRLELMQIPGIKVSPTGQTFGWIYIAIATGSKAAVDLLTERLRSDGFTITGEPRTTGDGYYESLALDPDGNRIEITV